MLRWRLNALYNKSTERQLFLQNIVLLVFGVHVFLLMTMIAASFFGDSSKQYTILMHQAGATYVLMPLQKQVASTLNTQDHRALPEAFSKKSQVINYETYEKNKSALRSKKTKALELQQQTITSKKTVVAPKIK